jgi:hypothetical protein
MAKKPKQVELPSEDETPEEKFTEGLGMWSPSALLDGTTEEAWIKAQGWTPLEYLTHTYRNPWQETKDRIAAAKAVLEYVHRKLPQRIELQGDITETRKLTAESLGKLSDDELTVFTKLLEKLSD